MSIDRNAKDPLRLRRNQQRLRVGDNNDSIVVDPTGGISNTSSGLGISVLTTKGDVFTYSTHPTRLPVGSDGQILSADSTQTTGLKWVPAGSGTVTSVAVALPATVFGVSGSPVTTAGTITGSFVTQAANTFFKGPNTGTAAIPSFAGIVAADLGLTTKGDLLTFGTVLAKLGVGSQGQVLTVNTAAANSIDWETSATGGSPFVNSSSLTIASSTFSQYPLMVVGTGASTSVATITGIGLATDTSATAAHVPGAAIWYTEIPNSSVTVGTLDIGVRYQGVRTSGLISALTLAPDIGAGTTKTTFNNFSTLTAGTFKIIGSSSISMTPTTLTTNNSTSTSSTFVINSGVTMTLPSNSAFNASGTATVVNGGISSQIGSLLFVNTSVSTAVTAATDTNFNRSVTLPAGFFTVGKTIRVRGIVVFNSDLISTITIQLKCGTVSLDSRTLTPTVNGTGLRAIFDMTLTCFSTGASGTLMRMGTFIGEQNAGSFADDFTTVTGGGTATINTTTTEVIQFSAAFSATSATNTAQLFHITVESVN